MILTLQRLQIFAWMVVVSLSSRGVCAWSTSSWNRRDVLRIGSVASTGILSGSVTVVASAIAADDSPMGRVNELLARLHNVPTFCIVSPEGAAYMVLRKDQAMAVGYAFATFEGALAVLGDAQRNAKEKGYFDTWKDATITTIPMDVAIRLALKKRQRQSQKDQTLDSLLEIIPGADDRQDGIAIDAKFKGQGRVPLFYTEDGRGDVKKGANAGDKGPLTVYLARRDLINDWVRTHPDSTALPAVKAIDLISIFENLLLGRSNLPTLDLIFEPNKDSLKAVKELKDRGLAPYNPNKMII